RPAEARGQFFHAAVLQLRGKLLAGLAGILATLLAVCALCNLVVGRYSSKIDSLLEQDYQSAVACQSMKESLEAMLDVARGSVSEATPATGLDAQRAISEFSLNLERQTSATDAPGEAEATAQLAEKWRTFVAQYQELFDPAKSPSQRQALL